MLTVCVSIHLLKKNPGIKKINVQLDIGEAMSSKLDSVLLKLEELDIKKSVKTTDSDGDHKEQ